MTPEEAREHLGLLVRCGPARRGRHCFCGRLIGLSGKDAIVKPFGHRGPARVPVRNLKPWKSPNARETTV